MTMTMTMPQNAGQNFSDQDDQRALRLWPRMIVGLVLALALIGGLGGWAFTAQLAGAVISQGVVVVEANLQAIQHRDGGIVSEIAVKEGDVVEAGQVLLRLDDAQTRSELAIVRGQITELEIRRARLVAERDGLAGLDLSADWTADHLDATDLVAGETRLFDGQRQGRDSQRQQLALGVTQIEAEIVGLRGQRAAKLAEIKLVGAEYERVVDLVSRDLIETSRLYATEREKERLNGELSEIDSAIARAGSRISEIGLQVLAIDDTARTEAQRELGSLETRLAELEERAVAIQDRLSRSDLRAPIAGVVNELHVHTIGGVVTPAQVLVTLVPLGSDFLVEIRLQPSAIEQVHLDQEARLRFTAFNQQVTPELIGHITHISAATTVDPATGQAFYQGIIAISDDELGKLGESVLLPGMPVEAFVATQDRTVASYMMKPILDRFFHALRER